MQDSPINRDRPRAEYERRVTARQAALEHAARRDTRLANARAAVFLAGLGLARAPVRARRLCVSPLSIAATINVRDSLQEGQSHAKVRRLFEAELAPGDKKPRGNPELMPRARRAVCLAAEEAQRAGRLAYGPEHLLVGLLRTNAGMGVQLLNSFGVNLDAVRAMVTPDSPDAKQSERAEDLDRRD